MNNTLHTPGPWRLEITDTGFRVIYSDSALRSHIAALNEAALCEEHGDTFANARLIASAPDLLQVVEDYVLLCDLHDYVGAVPDAARAALRKAKGGA